MVIDVLVAMGYGGSRKEAGVAFKRGQDEGIDGQINEDRLGLEIIYVQAKKWKESVGRPELQKFVGALEGQRAKKGIFITTSTFTSEAKRYVENIDRRVVLIEGEQLAEYMIQFSVGVNVSESFEIKKIDLDYFDEESGGPVNPQLV